VKGYKFIRPKILSFRGDKLDVMTKESPPGTEDEIQTLIGAEVMDWTSQLENT